MAKSKRRATYDDLLKLPEHLVGELIDGELIASARPASPHARAASILGVDLGGPFDRNAGSGGPGGWWILDEPQLRFGEDVLVPDLAGWRRERMPSLPDVASFELAPDWICEIISTSTEKIDRGRKTRIYARAGIRHMWMINPIVRLLEVFRLNHEKNFAQVASSTDEEKPRAEPFDAIELDLTRLWID
jgi:Uma2 family endonuclease